MGQVYGWRHAQKRWAGNLEDFKKRFRLCWEVEFWPWCWEVGVLTVEAYGWTFQISTGEDGLRSKTPWDVLNVGGDVNIVWLRKTFKNCVSLFVSKNRSQKLINVFVPEQRSRLCICFEMYFVFDFFWMCIVYVPLDWYHYDNGWSIQHLVIKTISYADGLRLSSDPRS